MECLEGPRLSDGILPAEKERSLAADGIAQVLQLEAIRVGGVELDLLDPTVPSQLDHRLPAVPRIVEEERAFRADHFELVALREARAAVELGEDVPGKPHRACEHPVGA